MRGDEDKRVYTVAYKIYDIKAIHHYEVHEEQGGDSYMDICETYFKVDRDTIEIIEVKDIDSGMHAGQLHRLKRIRRTKQLITMGIYSKLLEIQRSVRALLPNADGNNYKYISGSKVLGIVRPKMDELGVILKTEVLDITNIRQDYTVGRDQRPKSKSYRV